MPASGRLVLLLDRITMLLLQSTTPTLVSLPQLQLAWSVLLKKAIGQLGFHANCWRIQQQWQDERGVPLPGYVYVPSSECVCVGLHVARPQRTQRKVVTDRQVLGTAWINQNLPKRLSNRLIIQCKRSDKLPLSLRSFFLLSSPPVTCP